MPLRPSAPRQLLDLAFPFSLYEQAPFVGRDVSALTITTQGDTPLPAELDTEATLRTLLRSPRMGQLGGAAQTLIGSIDQGLEVTPRRRRRTSTSGRAPSAAGRSSSSSSRRCSRSSRPRSTCSRVAAGGASRSGRPCGATCSRLAFWLFVGLAFAVVARLGGWPQGDPLPIPPQAAAAQTWPVPAIVALVLVSSVAWIVARAPTHSAPRGRARGGAGRLHAPRS